MSESRQDGVYDGYGYDMSMGLSQDFMEFPYSAYDSYAAQPAYSSIEPSYYTPTPQFVLDGPKDNSQRMAHRFEQSASPPISMSQSLDHAPSSLSHNSVASGQSTASSAVGSPYSQAARSLPSQEQWVDHAGLGIAPSIVNDHLATDTFSLSGHDTEPLFYPNDKFPGDFVGESGTISSSFLSGSPVIASPISYFSLASGSVTSTFSSPALALQPSGPLRLMTIDTIPEAVNAEILSPSHVISSGSTAEAPVVSPTPSKRCYEPSNTQRKPVPFKSPTTPASAISLSGSSRIRKAELRKRSFAGADYRDTLHSQPFAKRTTPPPVSPTRVYGNQFKTPFFAQSSGRLVAPLQSTYPALIQSYDTPVAVNTPGQATAYSGNFHQFLPPAQMYQPPSPAPSDTSSHASYVNGPIRTRSVNGSPYLFQPYPTALQGRRPSIGSMHSLYSHDSPRSSVGPDGEGSERGRCPNQDCGRLFKDLKAHMLTHQPERPEKCPIVTCEYHQKGFARKYDKNRHTLTHYKGTMVCGFCPGPGSAAEKSFNRADVFKRHLTSVHGVEQNPPNSRKKSPGLSSTRKSTSASQDAAGKCSSCSITFSNAQDLFDHLDQCILNQLSRSDPSEAVNERCLAGIANDRAVQETMERNMLPLGLVDTVKSEPTDEDEEDDEAADVEEENDYTWTGTGTVVPGSRSGKGAINPGVLSHVGGGSSIVKPGRSASGGRGASLTRSKGGVPVVGKGRKKRKHYPNAWGCPIDKMKMKKRVVCVYDGQRRLWKDEMMLDNDFEVRMRLGQGDAYVTDLDVQTLKRTEALHKATDEEKGPWKEGEDADVTRLMF
ncbi:hypothetical protein MMC13_006171 [Lambiella insularis]|nr:hypothetical protein [Lambiella insularis]